MELGARNMETFVFCHMSVVSCQLFQYDVRMQFSWNTWPKPIIALAPIAGYTDSAYRQIVKKLINGIICFSELTSVAALHHRSKETYKMLDFGPGEFPVIMQLFGKEIPFFKEAGKILEEMDVAGIDINMGCPTTKVTSSECGAALLRNPHLAAEIVHALSQTVSIPVSVKTRLGYGNYDPEKFFAFCELMQEAGASLITIHGRTRSQGFSGQADWEPIYELKRRLKIPVIGNGDIRSVQDALYRIQNVDGIMVGRATLGDPWLIAEIAHAFRGESYARPKNIFEKLPVVLEHLRLAVEIYGERKAIIEMRKHLAAYLKEFQGVKEYVSRVMHITEYAALKSLLESIYELQKEPAGAL